MNKYTMSANRRDFLRGTAWMGVTAALAGCASPAVKFCGDRGEMSGFRVDPIRKVRIGFVGLGMRGPGAMRRMAAIPGMEIAALCDLYPERVAREQAWLGEQGRAAAAEYTGEEGWKALCESDLDLVYIATPWKLHASMALYAMERGKHVAIEVPAAMNVDECWALVETAERTRRHCLQLENCCYGEVEMLVLNLVRQGLLGELVHADGGYIHDMRELNFRDPASGGYQGYWRLKWNRDHLGNPYPTHGLLPLMQAMDINRGDRFDYLTCISSAQLGMDAYAKAKFGADSWQAKLRPRCGDMSTTVIRTVRGRTITVQHDVTSPRPLSLLTRLSGTLGIVEGDPLRVAFAKGPGEPADAWMPDAEFAEFKRKHEHPLWTAAGALARKIGGHGGMDFLMDLRLAYCLQNGEPLDLDVYDLATSCSLCELTERSAANRGASQDVPDFTRGAWKTAKPLGIVEVDLGKIGLGGVESEGGV